MVSQTSTTNIAQLTPAGGLGACLPLKNTRKKKKRRVPQIYQPISIHSCLVSLHYLDTRDMLAAFSLPSSSFTISIPSQMEFVLYFRDLQSTHWPLLLAYYKSDCITGHLNLVNDFLLLHRSIKSFTCLHDHPLGRALITQALSVFLNSLLIL